MSKQDSARVDPKTSRYIISRERWAGDRIHQLDFAWTDKDIGRFTIEPVDFADNDRLTLRCVMSEEEFVRLSCLPEKQSRDLYHEGFKLLAYV